MILNHDEGKVGAWAERDYRCQTCDQVHRYKRCLNTIPERCSVCDGLLFRYWGEGGLPTFYTKTKIRDVRFKLEDEVRRGKRPRAIDEVEHSIVTL